MVEPEQRSRERFGSILAELHQPELLVLALLYHDVGKWKEEDHAEESARMAQTMLDRLGVTGEARATVEFLIEQHLKMSLVAFRRDTEDPGVVRTFARLVATEEHLKMLCLMTLADVEAVSAEILTPWREELLWRLYVDAYNQLTLGYGDEVIAPGQAAVEALVARRPEDLDQGELSRFLEGFPQRYLAMFDAETIYRHARLARNMATRRGALLPGAAGRGLGAHGGHARSPVPVLEPVRRALLLRHGHPARQRDDRSRRDWCSTSSSSPTARDSCASTSAAPSSSRRVLRDVVVGRQDVAVLLARREGGLLHPPPARRLEPLVRFDQAHSQRYTVLEIVAQDAPGLLHRISLVISRHGCDVDLVLISTEGDRAIDVFHLTKEGAKLSEAAQQALKEDVEAMLEGRRP